ncbi:DinB family protein [Mucilaginibacter sp. SP1R1]|uniref:DinB family protein n=1 Tax=Mucilaginibacter sp. SP1R1 TaxID=2723091 RepID=UPI0016140E23|nr:DinB family protein [Mucilaginibacter sp. SP1R1]MBB6149405.1 hypothetical protein [Mucilaginibacter sp. SP1R1]
MATSNKSEVWLRGPLNNMPALLQPVAHALLQIREELDILMADFPDALLWHKVAGMASPGFHLQHLTGVLNRLFTYAKGAALNEQQLNYLALEGKPFDHIQVAALVSNFNWEIDNALQQLADADENTLTSARGVGRAQLQSTVIGLYVHAAEHTTRHFGQLLVTVAVLKSGKYI